VSRRLHLVCLALLAAFLLSGSGCGDRDSEPALRVLAAASLSDVVGPIAQGFEGARVATSFGASSALARQIRDGAPADVFLSASGEWMEWLESADALAGETIVLARNRLVCIASAGRFGADDAVGDLRALLEALEPADPVAIADWGVPAGEYARRALEHAGLLEAYASHLVGQKDVRAVLHAVESGELSAGFVYATDAAVARVDVLFELDAAGHLPIEYRAAALRGAPSPAQARRFLVHLEGEAARAALADAGFVQP
jgi:molybdate transport system substrate-binding protein